MKAISQVVPKLRIIQFGNQEGISVEIKYQVSEVGSAIIPFSLHTLIQVPRIKNEQTITQLEKVLLSTEGTSIESVKQPRQKLESLFLSIVEEAKLEQDATSGALHGGETASFLRGTQQGDELIDHLLQDQPEQLTQEVTKSEKVESTPKILDQLVNDDPTQKNLVEEARTEIDTPKGADSDVIDSLLDEKPQNTQGDD